MPAKHRAASPTRVRTTVVATTTGPLALAALGAVVAPAAAVALHGQSGAIAMLIITYMAVTSAASAQLISVSSIFTYDVYRVSFRSGSTSVNFLIAVYRRTGGPRRVRRSFSA